MEKVYFMNQLGVKLAGHLYPSEGHPLILFSHGFFSDKSSRGRFDRFAETLSRNGYAVLLFDYSGSGESEGPFSDVSQKTEDLLAASDFVKKLGYQKIGYYGHSLGARICLEAYLKDQNAEAMVLSGAGTGPVHYQWEDYFEKEQLLHLQKHGYMTVSADGKDRKITKQILLDFEQADQKTLLADLHCPVLFIHGEDWEEKILSNLTKEGMAWLNCKSQMTVLKGAAHSFMEHLDELEEFLLSWFLTYLPPFPKRKG